MSRRTRASVDNPEVVILAALLGTTPEHVVEIAKRQRRRAIVRLALVLIVTLVKVAVVIGGLYAFIILLWAAFGAMPAPDVTDVQLPTL